MDKTVLNQIVKKKKKYFENIYYISDFLIVIIFSSIKKILLFPLSLINSLLWSILDLLINMFGPRIKNEPNIYEKLGIHPKNWHKIDEKELLEYKEIINKGYFDNKGINRVVYNKQDEVIANNNETSLESGLSRESNLERCLEIKL